MSAHMDAAYLNATVSDALVEGFAAIARQQPADPVDALGKWLVERADALARAEKVSHPSKPVANLERKQNLRLRLLRRLPKC